MGEPNPNSSFLDLRSLLFPVFIGYFICKNLFVNCVYSCFDRFSGKVHGSLARAGKVRGQTPKVAKQDKKKKPRGRAHKRMQYNRRFVTAVVGFGKKRGPNSSEK
ncbi:unnamed protein product [Citrullus colocynthis]|uniref:40S ribosomal protein S30 n=1 Tax=Citrullus colocynthis TaxID=252529 RepID=A0ABP0ZAC8_9ROSI